MDDWLHASDLPECDERHCSCYYYETGVCCRCGLEAPWPPPPDAEVARVKDQALELAARGADRARVWATLCRRYPALESTIIEYIIEETFTPDTLR
ncbi:MAG: hypothetical protein JSW46_09365 [Gemmatimonadota bacterium]|nr:MAG: hypothetical protein JSW46_09365 [Gemmatimonadota bacterium]